MLLKQNELLKLAIFHGTPVMVIDHAVIRENYRIFTDGLPRVTPFYAIKANPETAIIKTLEALGAGFDVASIPEFNTVLSNLPLRTEKKEAFMREKVIYANPVKPNPSLMKLNGFGMRMTYDNFGEVDKIVDHCPDARLILRMDVPNEGAVVELSSKFGAPIEQCTELIDYAHEKGCHVEGISFHVGSQCNDPENYRIAFQRAHSLFEHADRAGIDFSVLDIGGGFPAPYDDRVLSFNKYADLINHNIEEYFTDPKYEIIAEPGRFLVATAGSSVVEIIGKSIRKQIPFYYINDGVYGTFSGLIFDHIPYHFKAFTSGKLVPSAVAGPTCDALDKIVMDDLLPDLSVGNLLYSENTGAYTNASATNFNGFDLPKVIHIN